MLEHPIMIVTPLYKGQSWRPWGTWWHVEEYNSWSMGWHPTMQRFLGGSNTVYSCLWACHSEAVEMCLCEVYPQYLVMMREKDVKGPCLDMQLISDKKLVAEAKPDSVWWLTWPSRERMLSCSSQGCMYILMYVYICTYLCMYIIMISWGNIPIW